MLKEALQFFSESVAKANSAKLLSIGGDGRKAYVDQNGTLTTLLVTPPLRSHFVNSVDDLIGAAQTWNDKPVIWINGDAVVLVPDDADRRDRVTLKLVKSCAFAKLIALAKTPDVDQAELVRIIRVDLQGTIGRAELLSAIRNIKFRQTTAGASNIQHGNESLGRTIEAEVSGAGNIPETVVVSCSVFSNPGEREKAFSVGCDLEIVPQEASFRFRPIPDEIERVTDIALADIRERIASALNGVSVFFGSP